MNTSVDVFSRTVTVAVPTPTTFVPTNALAVSVCSPMGTTIVPLNIPSLEYVRSWETFAGVAVRLMRVTW
jgi:hypothetical protein